MDRKQTAETVPGWDGNARGWRRYQREVMWYWLGTKKEQWKLLAPRLVARLTGPARLLAMSWNQTELAGSRGVANLIAKLQASPLVRKKLPNTAAMMSQYFNYKRNPHEGIQAYLVRESLYYEEFIESLLALEDNAPQLSIFDEDDDDEDGSSERSGGYQRVPRREPSDGADGEGSPFPRPTTSRPTTTRSVAAGSAHPPGLTPMDSLILTQLRGWRLLSGASLTAEEWRSILASTNNKLSYDEISNALSTLFDEQINFKHQHQSPHVLHLAENDDDTWWGDGDWWDEDPWAAAANWQDEPWWEDPGEVPLPDGDGGEGDGSWSHLEPSSADCTDDEEGSWLWSSVIRSFGFQER